MWSVYVHTNLQNGKQYVGVTSKGVMGRWERVLTVAQDIKCRKAAAENDPYLGATVKRQLLKLVGTIEYDVALGADQWKHEELLQTENLVEALLFEMQQIKELRTRAPDGYNRSDGGEIPPYTNITKLMEWVKDLAISRLAK